MKAIYQEHKEWESLKFPLSFSNLSFENSIYNFSSNCTITVWRDEEYNLKAIIEGISDDPGVFKGHIEEAGNFAVYETVYGSDPNHHFNFQLDECVVSGHTATMEDPQAFTFRFKAHLHFNSITRTEALKSIEGREIVRYEWFLASKINVLFPRSTQRQVESHFTKLRLDFDSEDNKTKQSSYSTGWDYLSLETEQFKCFVADVPKEFGPDWAKRICIEYRSSLNIPEAETRTAIHELMSFVLGTHLLRIGSTTMADEVVVKQIANSPWGDNVRSKCSKSPFPPVLLNSHYDWGRVELLANKLLPYYLEKRNTLELSSTLWKFWIAKELPVGVNLPILSSAIEVLVNKFLAAIPGISYTYLPQMEYLKLINEEIDAISLKLSNVPNGDRIVNKIKSAFNRGANEKMDLFFEKLGLPIGKIEREAIRARNTMAHGGLNRLTDEEVKDAIRKTRAYETLFNRILLKLLGYEEFYIDYYKEGHPSKKIEIPTGDGKIVKD